MARHSIRRPTSLRTQLMRSASVLAMVVALNHTPAKAQTLAVLNTAAAAARAATAVKFPQRIAVRPACRQGQSERVQYRRNARGQSLRAPSISIARDPSP